MTLRHFEQESAITCAPPASKSTALKR
ncbi:uncharacterized protein METZ01_LOCUS8130 [marine metagenome]|uniref:Uncharacterized protein n=1 Tax=marine metagenome TaxID=408172 RepID=A0A381NKZ9_9ZZZZ